jgi:hypothetical protein
MIFYPGLFSVDSLNIYQQALTGHFKNFHPPLLAFVLFLFLKAGGTVSLFNLIACLLGFLGVRRLSFALTNYFLVMENKRELIVCLVFLVLVMPLTPLSVYFATLWTDTWLTLLLLWIVALFLEVTLEIDRINFFKLFILIALISVSILVRSNSIILSLPLAVTLVYVLWRRSISRAGIALLTVLPFVSYFLFINLQYKVLDIQLVYPERVSFALDLASMFVYDPSICSTLELQSCQIVKNRINSAFLVGHGAIDHTFNQGWNYSDPMIVELLASPFLSSDLRLAATHYPSIYLKVKFLNYWDYIHPRNQYYYQSFIHPNGLGLLINSRFDDVRTMLFLSLYKVYSHPVLKYFSFVHLPWILVNLASIVFCFVYQRRSNRFRLIGLLFLIPATYTFSYLLALTASDFRFMYPSLVITQVMTLTILFSFISRSSIMK